MSELLKVELVAHTPNPEQIIAAAAKLCYSPVGVCDILEKQSDEQAKTFIDRLMSMGHESPIEHVSFTFAVEGISRIVETQLVRHRIASYSVQSGRYVKRDKPDFVVPTMIKESPQALMIYEDALNQTMLAYHQLTDHLIEQQIKAYCEGKGLEVVSQSEFNETNRKQYLKFEKVAIENARYVYPQSLATKLVFTMNARTLMNFLSHRTCRRAQDEIQALAWEVHRLVKEVAPTLAKYMGPDCAVLGKCNEGMMCCGKAYPKMNK